MRKHSLSLALLTGVLALSLGTRTMAAEVDLAPGEQYCFSGTEGGLLLTDVPEKETGVLLLGDRILRSGDVVARDQEVTFCASGDGVTQIRWICLREGKAAEESLTMQIGAVKNLPPTAEDSSFETFKNIPGEVPLTAMDPEGEPLTVTIRREPRRGMAEVAGDGTVTYTPQENKVGQDSFTYLVSDPAGNISEEATVRITIKKPSDRQTYGDLAGDPVLLPATWLRETGIFSGETVAGQLLFRPEQTVTRGEFLAMCAGFMGLETGETVATGFADEAATPAWLGPYVTAALRCGYLSGIPTEGGLLLDAAGEITQAQAGKLVGSILGLEQVSAQPVMGGGENQDWAAAMMSTLEGQGLSVLTEPQAAMTRRDAAMLLYSAWQYGQRQERPGLLAWAARS